MVKVVAASVSVSTIVHATEDQGKVIRAILAVCPVGSQKELEVIRMKGHYGNEIALCKITTTGVKTAEKFLAFTWRRLASNDRKEILALMESQLDSEGALHLRLGKQAALAGHLTVTDEDPIKVKILFRVSHGVGQAGAQLVRDHMALLS